MTISLSKPKEKWFFLIVLPTAIAIEWAFAATLDWSVYPRSEWVALVDLCLFVPLIYLLAFTSELGRKTRLLRASAIACIGLLAAGFIVPSGNQFIIGELSALRNLLFGFVLVFEGWVVWKVLSAIYRRGANAKQLERDFAVPEWVANLLILEARFWKAVWGFFRRK